MGHIMSGRKVKEVGQNVRCSKMFFIYTADHLKKNNIDSTGALISRHC